MKSKILVVVMLFLGVPSNGGEPILSPCAKAKNKIHCFLHNHEDLSKNPNWLEETYLEAEQQAIKCLSPKDTGEFLEFGLRIGGKAAIEEYFSGAIEKELLAKNSRCFLSALYKTSPKARDKICSMLGTPILLERKQVDELYAKYSKQAKLSKWVANCLKPFEADRGTEEDQF